MTAPILLELRGADALDDRAGDRDAVARVEAGEEDGELVAAEPEALAALAQPRRDLAEHAVADRVPVAVVDLLEVVDVDEAERERLARRARRGASSRCSRSWKWRWLPRPVSGSVSARRIAFSAAKVERW